MATVTLFPHAEFLGQLESLGDAARLDESLSLSAALTRAVMAKDETGHSATASLMQLLQAQSALWKASADTGMVADELRRYQKFVRPGQPSPHIVQLRQQQAAARRAASQTRQAYITAAATFVRDAGLAVPPRVGLEVFISHWIEANVPKTLAAARL